MTERNLAGSTEKLRGLIPPLVLPLQDSGAIDYDGLAHQIDYVFAGGADGIWVNGTSGDFFALTEDERAEVVVVATERAAGRVPVIAQVGDASTRRTIANAHRALDSGADFIAVVLPYYLPYTQAELKQHFRIIAKEIGEPVFLYQIPQMSKVALSAPSIVELAQEGTLIGIKDSSGDLEFYQRLSSNLSGTNVSFRCFTGIGALMDLSLLAGGHGLMCAIANLLPHLCKNIYQDATAGNWLGARATQQHILTFINALAMPERTTWAPVVAVYKWMLRELGVINSDRVCEPLQPLSTQEQELLRIGALPLAKELCAGLIRR